MWVGRKPNRSSPWAQHNNRVKRAFRQLLSIHQWGTLSEIPSQKEQQSTRQRNVTKQQKKMVTKKDGITQSSPVLSPCVLYRYRLVTGQDCSVKNSFVGPDPYLSEIKKLSSSHHPGIPQSIICWPDEVCQQLASSPLSCGFLLLPRVRTMLGGEWEILWGRHGWQIRTSWSCPLLPWRGPAHSCIGERMLWEIFT